MSAIYTQGPDVPFRTIHSCRAFGQAAPSSTRLASRVPHSYNGADRQTPLSPATSTTTLRNGNVLEDPIRPPASPSGVVSTSPTPLATYSPTRITLWDALKFTAAPEVINGRLAMLGFLTGAWREFVTGETMMNQLQHRAVGTFLLALVTIYASLVPITKGARYEAFGVFTPVAELVNGRAAMLAFATVLALEAKAHVAFF